MGRICMLMFSLFTICILMSSCSSHSAKPMDSSSKKQIEVTEPEFRDVFNAKVRAVALPEVSYGYPPFTELNRLVKSVISKTGECTLLFKDVDGKYEYLTSVGGLGYVESYGNSDEYNYRIKEFCNFVSANFRKKIPVKAFRNWGTEVKLIYENKEIVVLKVGM